MTLVVLATDSPSTWMLVNALKENYPDLCVCIEKPISRFVLLKNRLARVGLLSVIGQILFLLFLILLRGLSASRIQALIIAAGLSTRKPDEVAVIRFDSVNSQECIRWLRNKSPEVVVLNGTRIVTPSLLASCNAVFLNIHCGITPAYRGVHGGYWALAVGDKDNVGVTIHLVDAGIDTGPIVFQKTISVNWKDNFAVYPIKQYIAGIPLMQRAISNAISGEIKTQIRDDLQSSVWHHPTIWQYLWVFIRRGIC